MLGLNLTVSIAIIVLHILIEGTHGSRCRYKNHPKQIRLALRPTGMTVSWATDGYFGDNDTPEPQVAYGTSPIDLSSTSMIGFTSMYNPASVTNRFFHNVHLDELEPETTYFYCIKASTRCVRGSNIMKFTTSPIARSSQQSINISVVGDLGLNDFFNNANAENTIGTMEHYVNRSNFFIHLGDIAYADVYGPIVNFSFYDYTWNLFQEKLAKVTSQLPYQVLPGNHDAACFLPNASVCPDYLKNFTAYQNRFYMSGELSGGYKNMWYSFDYGPIHVIILNTETDFPNAPSGPGTVLNAGHFRGIIQQIEWLKADLEKATDPTRRAQVPWIVAAGHRPLFGSKPGPIQTRT